MIKIKIESILNTAIKEVEVGSTDCVDIEVYIPYLEGSDKEICGYEATETVENIEYNLRIVNRPRWALDKFFIHKTVYMDKRTQSASVSAIKVYYKVK